ncbi:LysR family transcriptional regulator [Aerococcaceae bacterium DSM 111020]|nr:LysR family transcriptional regulator [Aerococcaceae bacterium DSM 111020]
MQFDILYYLIELSETQSLTEVARKMNITPSALAK